MTCKLVDPEPMVKLKMMQITKKSNLLSTIYIIPKPIYEMHMSPIPIKM